MLWLIPLAFAGALLYRLRGGWFRDLTGAKTWWNGSQAMRLIWSIPTAALATALVEPTPIVYIGVALIVSIFASMALIGHGAHMTFDYASWGQVGRNRTEMLTRWLPGAFGIDVSDRNVRLVSRATLDAYNIVGMSIIGLVRNGLALAPLWFANGTAGGIAFALIGYALIGLTHGPLYWLGFRLARSSAAGELLVGGTSWAALVLILT